MAQLASAGYTVLDCGRIGWFAIDADTQRAYERDVEKLRTAHKAQPDDFWNPDEQACEGYSQRWIQLCRLRYTYMLDKDYGEKATFAVAYTDPA